MNLDALMTNFSLSDRSVQLGLFFLIAIVTIFYLYSKLVLSKKLVRFLAPILTGYAIAQILFILFLWVNHIDFPLNLEAMELLRVQHLQRLMQGLPLYPEPSSDFVALAYNPLSYILTEPFALIFGVNLFTMRLVAILGMAGAGIVMFMAVRRQTDSNSWGLIATGLFAAAYRVMDTYLDNAHAESWLLCSILLGCYLIDRAKNWRVDCLAVLCFVAGFWFKQQGAIFAIAALVFLTWRSGWKIAWRYWLIAGGLGAGLYIAMPDWVLGSRFHYFTWQVPKQWVALQYWELIRPVKLTLMAYPILAVASLFLVWRDCKTIWNFMLPVALLSGFLASMTPGSNNNVYIPMGTWLILVGTIAIHHGMQQYPVLKHWDLHLLALALSFACFAYNPISVITASESQLVYQDFVSYLKTLSGTIYAPWLGQLQDERILSPTLHWVPLDDLVRGPKSDPSLHPPLEVLLKPVIKPTGQAYLLHNLPLEQDGRLGFLKKYYVLDTDLGPRFQALRTLPKHYTLDYPRYLYRYVSK